MNREGKKCVLYPRVSTEMQVDGYSLEGQKNSLKRFADREEMEIVGIYEDAGKSGKSIEGRYSFMGNENFIQNTELKNEQLKDETEIFNSFINVMVQIVEKYGKTVLQELDCAA